MKKLVSICTLALVGFAYYSNPVHAQSSYVPLSSTLRLEERAANLNYPPYPDVAPAGNPVTQTPPTYNSNNAPTYTNNTPIYAPQTHSNVQPSVPYYYGGQSTSTSVPLVTPVGHRRYRHHAQVQQHCVNCGGTGCAAAPVNAYAPPENVPAPVPAPVQNDQIGCADMGTTNVYSQAMSGPWTGQQTIADTSCLNRAPRHGRRHAHGCRSCGAGYGVSPVVPHPHAGYGHALLPSDGAQWFGGVNTIFFFRDDADEIALTRPAAASAIRVLTTRATDDDEFYGGELIVGRHFKNGISAVGSYWGLFSDTEQAIYSGTPYVALPTLDRLNYDPGTSPSNTVEYFMNSPQAVGHRVRLENEFHNFELNFLRRSLVHGVRRDRYLDVFAGGRYLKINEEFQFASAYDPANFGADNRDIYYNIDTENNLYGIQLGAVGNRALTKRLSLEMTTKFGAYGNAINHRQRIYGNNGDATVNTGAYSGQAYNVDSYDDDIAMIGELDLGMRYAMNKCWNLNFGFRVIGINGIALTTDQIPRDFSDLAAARQIDSNGSMILYGGYGGITYNF